MVKNSFKAHKNIKKSKKNKLYKNNLRHHCRKQDLCNPSTRYINRYCKILSIMCKIWPLILLSRRGCKLHLWSNQPANSPGSDKWGQSSPCRSTDGTRSTAPVINGWQHAEIKLQPGADPEVWFGRPSWGERHRTIMPMALRARCRRHRGGWGMGMGYSPPQLTRRPRVEPWQKLCFVKYECQRSHLVARISLHFLLQFYSGCTDV